MPMHVSIGEIDYPTAQIYTKIKADVAIKTSLFRLNAANVIPRIVPPVPSKPATKPEMEPPIIEFV